MRPPAPRFPAPRRRAPEALPARCTTGAGARHPRRPEPSPEGAPARRITSLLRALAAVTALLALAGCVVVETEPEHAGSAPRILDFAESELSGGLWPVGFPHGVNLIVELAPEDLPPRHRELLLADLYRPVPLVKGGRSSEETWRVGPHEFVFANGQFHVGTSRYTPRPRARLYLFKEREQRFVFVFHRQTIVVESDTPWTPSIYYSVTDVPAGNERGEEISGGSRSRARRGVYLTREALEIGPHTIEVDPREPTWQVNGRPFTPGTSKPLVLEGTSFVPD